MLQAIETIYNGYRFRSRLEARWAVFLDTLSIRYEYEAEGYDLGNAGWYLPDFWLPELGFWIEIKATTPTDDERQKAMELSHQAQKPVVIQGGLPASRYWPELNAHSVDTEDTIEIFAGLPTDRFSDPHITQSLNYLYSESEYMSLGEMLSIHFNDQSLQYDGTNASLDKIIKADQQYLKEKQGIAIHPRWQWGRHTTMDCWISEAESHMTLGFRPDCRTHKAYIAARSARFEHGETPNASA